LSIKDGDDVDSSGTVSKQSS